jgi:hypothetical protein
MRKLLRAVGPFIPAVFVVTVAALAILSWPPDYSGYSCSEMTQVSVNDPTCMR